jgi:hypothetical protein
MQYPPGTSFVVNRALLSKSILPFKLAFRDGSYRLLNIKIVNDKPDYTFLLNGVEKVIISFNSCRDADRIIAFCRNEIYKESITLNDDQESF